MKSDSICRSSTGLGSINMQQARWLVIHVQLFYINVKDLRSTDHALPVLYTVTVSKVAGQSVTSRKKLDLLCFLWWGYPDLWPPTAKADML